MSWRKSSYSYHEANCVETAPAAAGMAVRDSKDPSGPVLEFGAGAWREFVQGVKAGP